MQICCPLLLRKAVTLFFSFCRNKETKTKQKYLMREEIIVENSNENILFNVYKLNQQISIFLACIYY